jgi:hypothetical protein
MSDQNQIFGGQGMVNAGGINADLGSTPTDIVDDVLSDFFGPSQSVPVETIGGATEQRPELRTVSSEEFVRRFRQETGE